MNLCQHTSTSAIFFKFRFIYITRSSFKHWFSCIPCSVEIIFHSYKYTWHQSVSYHRHITKCEDETKEKNTTHESLHIIQFPCKLNEYILVVSKHFSWLKMQWRELYRLLFAFDFISFLFFCFFKSTMCWDCIRFALLCSFITNLIWLWISFSRVLNVTWLLPKGELN